MKLGALVSGGKDSLLAACHAAFLNHTIECVMHLETTKEVDSYLIQSVGSSHVKTIAQAMEIPYLGNKTNGIATQKDAYITDIDVNDETYDLYILIKEAKLKHKLDGIISGAIESDYQRLRIEFICQKLSLTSFAPLWKSDPATLFKELQIVDSIIVKVASLGLNQTHIGKNVVDLQSELMDLFNKYKIHPLGEGGEFETFTTYCPLFKHSIELDYNLVDEKQSSFSDITSSKLVPIKNSKSLSILASTRLFDNDSSTVYSSPIKAPCNKLILPVIDHVFTVYANYISLSNFFIYKSSEDFNSSVSKGLTDLKLAINKFTNSVDLSALLIVHVYIQDMSLFGQFNTIYGSLFSIRPPARACVQLDLPSNVICKIDVIISKPAYDRKVMHVSSISHKYPANIGPYSQCQSPLIEDGISFIAGQVGFVPIKLSYPTSENEVQATIKQNSLSIQHVKSICDEMGIVPATAVGFTRNVSFNSEILNKMNEEYPSLPAFLVQVDRLPKDGQVEWLCMATAKKLVYKCIKADKEVIYENKLVRIVLGNGDHTQLIDKERMQSFYVVDHIWERKESSAFIVPVNKIYMRDTYKYAMIEIK
eukprot:NODE_25_length_35605_cov_0.353461.p7 type:complete len:593 gc:universal NODE_25_length_35605_cov_0.353461:23605-25383(+)